MKFRIISTGSKGNAILYDNILVDCGVPYSKLVGHDIKLVLLTHIHKDHLNIATLKKLGVPVVCGEWLEELLLSHDIKPFVVDMYGWYGVSVFMLSAFPLDHDVENCGWRIFIGKEKAFHATDTSSLDGVSAVGYDLFAIESNYGDLEIQGRIKVKKMLGEYAYEEKVVYRHLSREQAEEFIARNAKKGSEVHYLHQHE